MIYNNPNGSLSFPPQPGATVANFHMKDFAEALCDLPETQARWRVYYDGNFLNQLVIEVEEDGEVVYLRAEIKEIRRAKKKHGWESIKGGFLAPTRSRLTPKATPPPEPKPEPKPKTGKYLPGTHLEHRRWQARINVNRQKISLGWFDTEEEAHQAYLDFKAKMATAPPSLESPSQEVAPDTSEAS